MKRIGNYRIERQLAITGTSVHYEAVHLVMPRRAIIKVTHAAISLVKSFLTYASSADGQTAATKVGYAPLPDEVRTKVASTVASLS